MAVGETTEGSRRTNRVLRPVGAAPLIARYGLVVVLAWFGAMKFTYYESHGVSPFVADNPFLSWVYHIMSISAFGRVLGTAELVTAALLALRPWYPKASVIGGVLATAFFLGTLSFMVSTPGIGEPTAGGFPVHERHRVARLGPVAVDGLYQCNSTAPGTARLTLATTAVLLTRGQHAVER
jgi:hypothetical protein